MSAPPLIKDFIDRLIIGGKKAVAQGKELGWFADRNRKGLPNASLKMILLHRLMPHTQIEGSFEQFKVDAIHSFVTTTESEIPGLIAGRIMNNSPAIGHRGS